MTGQLDDALCDDLAATLAKLAEGCNTAADVARKLARAGVTGNRGTTCGCPAGVWVTRQIGPPPDFEVHVGIDVAEVMAPAPPGGLMAVAVAQVPQVIASFVVAFDAEVLFPDLEARNSQPLS